MTRAHKSPVYAADTTELRKLGTDLQAIIDAAMESALKVHNTVYDLDWLGKARDASLNRADRELVQDRRVGEVLHTLKNAYINGADTMQPMITTLRTEGQALEADGFSVSERWEVKDTFNYEFARNMAPLFGLTVADVNDLETRRATEAANANARLQPLADELGAADENTRTAIASAVAELDTNAPESANTTHVVLVDNEGNALEPGQVVKLGIVGGTGAQPPIEGLGAVDLGEVVQLPNGQLVAVFGDSFSGNKVGEGTHYHSVAVPVSFDPQGRVQFGTPYNIGKPGQKALFELHPDIPKDTGNNTLPAGSIRMADGTTYMMVASNRMGEGMAPVGGSWFVEVTDNPAQGWNITNNSYQQWDPSTLTGGLSQISGYQAADGYVYIAGDSFDRSQPVTMYRVDAEHVTNRDSWQPWTGNDWGTPGQQPVAVSDQRFGELSLRPVDGHPVLSGFNAGTGNVEVNVGAGNPEQVFSQPLRDPIVVAQTHDRAQPSTFVWQPYGGYILPNSTLSSLDLFISQWNTLNNENGVPIGTPYNTQQVVVNASTPP